MSTSLRIVSLTVLALTSGGTAAHGGGLNAEGCHHDRKNGGYHCHRGPASRSPNAERFAPARSTPSNAAAPRGGGAYANCSAARAAGAAPVRRGDSGYGSHLDRDNDGIGCE